MNPIEKKIDPFTIIIFGASGDLTKRKLIPALFHLFKKNKLSDHFIIIGFAHSTLTHASFRDQLKESLQRLEGDKWNADDWKKFNDRIYYQKGNFDKLNDYNKLNDFCSTFKDGNSNRLYYLATAPRFFKIITERLGSADMAKEKNGWRRLVIEKPFGHDLISAQVLNSSIHGVFQEHQIFRIDHYLGKETAQNLLFFRFANTIFDPVWNRNYIDHVQITVAEDVDVGHRGGYYDQAGVIRDMFQNHMLQLLALTAMEPPVALEADAIRNEKIKIFSAIRPFLPDQILKDTLRAQYKGYRDAPAVDSESQTETFSVLRLYIDNWRWQGVPFYLRSGKAMPIKTTQIVIQFRQPPSILFPMARGKEIPANKLSFCIQPDEGMHLRFEVKVPDTLSETSSVDMEFHYEDAFGADAIPDAYDRLLLDALKGDASLFTRSDGIEHAWKIMDSIIHGWKGDQAPPLFFYRPGSWGPGESDLLIQEDGYRWERGCQHRDKA